MFETSTMYTPGLRIYFFFFSFFKSRFSIFSRPNSNCIKHNVNITADGCPRDCVYEILSSKIISSISSLTTRFDENLQADVRREIGIFHYKLVYSCSLSLIPRLYGRQDKYLSWYSRVLPPPAPLKKKPRVRLTSLAKNKPSAN